MSSDRQRRRPTARAWLPTSLAVLLASSALADVRQFEKLPVDSALEESLARIARESLEEFPAKLKPGNLSITVVDLSADPKRASFEGSASYYSASVVKLFYLVSVHDQIAKGKLTLNQELQRSLRDMIVDSSNDATSYVVDRLTGTTSGPELTGRAFAQFFEKRNLMNRYFRAMGYDLSALGKTWCEGVYGREKQILGPNREDRNRLTSDGVAALTLWIAQRQAVSVEASNAMLSLMQRDAKDGQVLTFTGEGLPPGAHLWSKAGWTSEVRHDAAYVELPNGRKYVVVVLTRGTDSDETILPAISRKIASLFE